MNKVFAVSGVVIKEMVRRKDFYVLFVLTVVITALMGSINLFNEDAIVRYLKEICLMLIWVSTLVIAVTTAARQIPAERESRTIFPLLAKPISRTQVLLGKFTGCWIATGRWSGRRNMMHGEGSSGWWWIGWTTRFGCRGSTLTKRPDLLLIDTGITIRRQDSS